LLGSIVATVMVETRAQKRVRELMGCLKETKKSHASEQWFFRMTYNRRKSNPVEDNANKSV
jgi:hypothetical protein